MEGIENAEGETTVIEVAEKENAASEEPKVLSESAQLAQQISAAIAEHAQQATKTSSNASAEVQADNHTSETGTVTVTETNPVESSVISEAPVISEAAAFETTKVEAPEHEPAPPIETAAEQVEVNSPAEVASNGATHAAPAKEVSNIEIETTERKTTTEVNIAPPSRASNDPRKAPKPVSQVNIITETVESHASRALDTSLPPSVDHNPRPVSYTHLTLPTKA